MRRLGQLLKMVRKTPRRFAPLRPDAHENSPHPRLQGIVFDVDGTLW